MFGLIGSFFISLAVSLLPESVKDCRGMWKFNTVSAHVLSGILESITGLAALLVSYFSALDHFTDILAHATQESSAKVYVDESALHGMGLIGLASFLIQPASLLCYVLLAEGFVRFLSAVLTRRNLGTLFLAVPYRLFLAGHNKYLCRRYRSSFGPPRQDEILTPEKAESGMLEIYCARQQPWHDRQALEYANVHYIFQDMHHVRRGDHWAHCYRFRTMHPGEIIRGALVRYSK